MCLRMLQFINAHAYYMCQEADTPRQSTLAHLHAQNGTLRSVHSAALAESCRLTMARVCVCVFVCACRWPIGGEAVARR